MSDRPVSPEKLAALVRLALLPEEVLRFDVALAQTALAVGANPNEWAGPAECRTVHAYAARTVWRYAMLGEVLKVGHGIRVVPGGIDFSSETQDRVARVGALGIPLSRIVWPLPGVWDRLLDMPPPPG